MTRWPALVPALALLAGCAAAVERESVADNAAIAPFGSPGPIDDGSYLSRIDPLGGQWRVDAVGQAVYPPGDRARANFSYVTFSDGGFLNSYAGCSGGYPAFYRLDGPRIAVTRREKVTIGKCADPGAAGRETMLAAFLDRAVGWSIPAPGALVLTAADGTRARLSQPPDPHPELSGRWRVVSIGGAPFMTREQPGEVGIGFGAFGGGISAKAACNHFSANLTIAGSTLDASDGVSTLIGCDPPRQALDAKLFGAVGGVRSFVVRPDGRLVLSGATEMVLERFPPPDRHLVGSYTHCGNTVLGAGHAGEVTLAIDRNTIRDNSGCTARYTADGPGLDLTLSAETSCRATAASPMYDGTNTVEIGGALSPLAILRPDGFGFDRRGQLILRTVRGNLTLCRAGQRKPFGSG